jgi:hypothetical protein
MSTEAMEAQETRCRRQTLALTPSEENDAKLVAAFRNTDLSIVLREERMVDIAAEAARLRTIAQQNVA